MIACLPAPAWVHLVQQLCPGQGSSSTAAACSRACPVMKPCCIPARSATPAESHASGRQSFSCNPASHMSNTNPCMQAVQPGSPHLPHKLSQSSSGHRLDECVQGKQRAALYAESDTGSSIAGHSGTTLRESSPLQQHLEVSSQPTTPPARIQGWPLHRLRRRAE